MLISKLILALSLTLALASSPSKAADGPTVACEVMATEEAAVTLNLCSDGTFTESGFVTKKNGSVEYMAFKGGRWMKGAKRISLSIRGGLDFFHQVRTYDCDGDILTLTTGSGTSWVFTPAAKSHDYPTVCGRFFQ